MTKSTTIIKGWDRITQYAGISKSQLKVFVADGRFPKPVKISDRAVGWLDDEVAAWQKRLRKERDVR
jgi:prophage regulatory protein